MDKLPKDILSNILLNQSVKEILEQCRTNKNLNTICNDGYFWHRYLKENYKIEFPFGDLKIIAIRAEKLMKGLEKYNVTLSLDSFKNMAERFEKFNEYLKARKNLFGSFPDYLDFIHYEMNLEDHYEVEIEIENNIYNNGLTNIGKQFLDQLLSLIKESTDYISNKKVITLNYNQDMADLVLLKLSSRGEHDFLLILTDIITDLQNN